MAAFASVDSLLSGAILASESLVVPGYSSAQTLVSPVAGLTVFVYERGTVTQAPCFEDQHGAGSPVAQPLTTDASGLVIDGSGRRVFTAQPVELDVVLSGGALPAPVTVPVGMAPTSDATAAPLDSPTFTGTPRAPTPPVDDSSTRLATTAWAMAQAASGAPAMDGAAAGGVSTRWARADHVHPVDTSRLAAATPLNAIASPTAAVGLNGQRLTNLANPAGATDALNLGSADARYDPLGVAANALQIANNLSDVADKGTARRNLGAIPLSPAVAVATSNVTLSGTQTIDGQPLNAGDPALLTGQTNPAQNGPWIVQAGAWIRPSEFTGTVGARTCSVLFGTTYAGSVWLLQTSGLITVDTSSQTWIRQLGVSPGGTLTNPMSHVGALIVGGTAGAATELLLGASGTVLGSNGTTAAWVNPSLSPSGTGPGSAVGGNTGGVAQAIPNPSTFGFGVYYAIVTGASTTVAAASSGVDVRTFTGAGTLNVTSTTGYATSGTIVVATSNLPATITYAGTTGTTFTGCTTTAGSGTLASGGAGTVQALSTFTMPAATTGASFLLVADQDGTGSHPIAFGGTSIRWQGEPRTTTVPYGRSAWQFVCDDNSTWTGWAVGSLSVNDRYRISGSHNNNAQGFASSAIALGGTAYTPTIPHEFGVGQGAVVFGAGGVTNMPTVTVSANLTNGSSTVSIPSGQDSLGNALVQGVTYYIVSGGTPSIRANPAGIRTLTITAAGAPATATLGQSVGTPETAATTATKTLTITSVMPAPTVTTRGPNDGTATRKYAMCQVLWGSSGSSSVFVTPAAYTSSTPTNGVLADGYTAAQTLQVSAGATGTIKLTYQSVQTAGTIDVTAAGAAATVQSALEGLSTIGVGNVKVYGTGALNSGTPFSIVFAGALNATSLKVKMVTTTQPTTTGSATIVNAPFAPQVQVGITAATLAAAPRGIYAIYGDNAGGGAVSGWPLLGLLWFVPPTVGPAVANMSWTTAPLFTVNTTGVFNGTDTFTYIMTGNDFANNETTPLGTTGAVSGFTAGKGIAGVVGTAVTWDFMPAVLPQSCMAYQSVNLYRYKTSSGAATAQFMATVPVTDTVWADYGILTPGVVATTTAAINANTPIVSIPAYTVTSFSDRATITITDGVHSDTCVVDAQAGAHPFSQRDTWVPAYQNAIPVFSFSPANTYAAGAQVQVTKTPPTVYNFTDVGATTASASATLLGGSPTVSGITPALASIGATFPNVSDAAPYKMTLPSSGAPGAAVSAITPALASADVGRTLAISGNSIIPKGSVLTITGTTTGTLSLGTSGAGGTNKSVTLSAIPANTSLTITGDGTQGTLSQNATAGLTGAVLTLLGLQGSVGVPAHVPLAAPLAPIGIPLKTVVAAVTAGTVTLRDAATTAMSGPVLWHDDTDAMTNGVVGEGTLRLGGGFYFHGYGAANASIAMSPATGISGPSGPPATTTWPLLPFANPLPDSLTNPSRATLIPRNLYRVGITGAQGALVEKVQFLSDRQVTGVNYGGNDLSKYFVMPMPPAYLAGGSNNVFRDITDCNMYICANWQTGTGLIDNIATKSLRYCILLQSSENTISSVYGDGTTVYQNTANVPQVRLGAAIRGTATGLAHIRRVHVDGTTEVHLTTVNASLPGVILEDCWSDDSTLSFVLDTPVSLDWNGNPPSFNHWLTDVRAIAGGGYVVVQSTGYNDSTVGTAPNNVTCTNCHFGGLGLYNQGQHDVKFIGGRGGPGTFIPVVPGNGRSLMRVDASDGSAGPITVLAGSSTAGSVRLLRDSPMSSTPPTTLTGDSVTAPATLFVIDYSTLETQPFRVPAGTALTAGDNVVGYLRLPGTGLYSGTVPNTWYGYSAVGDGQTPLDQWKVNGTPIMVTSQLDSVTGQYAGMVGEGVSYNRNAQQTLSATGGTSGSFSLNFNGAAIPATITSNSTASAAKTAITGMSTVGANNVTVTGGPLNTAPLVITFTGALANAAQPLMVISSSTIVGATPAIATTFLGAPSMAQSFATVANLNNAQVNSFPIVLNTPSNVTTTKDIVLRLRGCLTPVPA